MRRKRRKKESCGVVDTVENRGRARRRRPTFKVVNFGGDLLMHEIDGAQRLWKEETPMEKRV